ncbi:MAG: hypothetical protein R3C19_23410 [Planctomycetaceae bacterium]
MTTRSCGFLALGVLLSIPGISGCGVAEQEQKLPVMQTTASEHGHGHGHAHPESLPEAIAEIKELRDTVRDAFAKNDHDAAHGPMHDVGDLLGHITELAAKANLTDEQMATIKASTEELFDAFGAVDKAMHPGKDENADPAAAWKEVAGKIDAAIDSLAAASPAAEGHAEHDDHSDEHADADSHDADSGQ